MSADAARSIGARNTPITGLMRRGFTLIEAVASIVILSVAVPPMLFAVRALHRSRSSAVMASTARWLAVEKLEDVIADRHSATRGYSYLTAGNYAVEWTVTGFTAFTRSVAFVQTGADLSTPGTGYKRCTVTVSWTDQGSARSLAIATVVTDYTP